MPIDKIIVSLFGLGGIIFTYWFFLLKKEKKAVAASGSIDIVIDGGYQPDVISIPKGKTTKLNFIRKDPSSCLEEIIISDFKIRRYLPMNEKVSIEITPAEAGEYAFECGMNMFHGKIVVR